ncbi:DUF2069 domain-containing protein [Cupriavidus metallidurans]|uniref:DUF2069 domain-containing protein n=1 Tax=Cupriavidus metallidurans TaxID=119219 RepID=UPI001CCA5028|nr:DUF2069 domain-containing protein [Cupriavidus metallidurans]UBM12147.1 DUF2069 domain-containing protein [Cupriavidus metallidurans]
MNSPDIHRDGSPDALHNPALWRLSLASLIALMLLCIAWEWFLAPLRPGGSWLVLKFVLLLPVLRGVLARNRYTMQWSSMLILLYFTEGIVRATSDRAPSSWLAWGEVALTLLFFFSTILYLRPFKRRAKALAKTATKTATKTQSNH